MAPNRSISPLSHTKVFISYSHADREWLDRLKRHLRPLIRDGQLDCWDDTHIKPGDDWQQEIRTALDAAQVAVLLISADFFASDFIDETELLPLLAAAQAKGVRILPLILSACRFARDADLARFQAVNPPDQPLDMMPKGEQEEILERLAQTIESSLDPPSPTPDRRLDVPDTQSRKHFTRLHPWKLAVIAAPLAIIIAIYILIAFDRDLLLRLHLPPKITAILVQILPDPPKPFPWDCGEDDCPEMMVVPAGTFMMGSPDSEPDRSDDEGPQKHVTIDHDFKIGRHEVTIKEWRMCDSSKCKDALKRNEEYYLNIFNKIYDDYDDYPVTVKLSEAEAYLRWLNEVTEDRFRYRLPSEAEWEYAARAGSTSARYWGDEIGVGNANCVNCGTTPTGNFKKNNNGLYDMNGNVWEWTECEPQNCAEANLYGGAWDNLRSTITPLFFFPARVEQYAPTFGFRVAVDLKEGDSAIFKDPHKNSPSIKVIGQFGIGIYEVKVKEWKQCVSEQKDDDKIKEEEKCADKGGHDEHPVTNISHLDAKTYLRWLSNRNGRTYRLPTEDEWKKAACGETDIVGSCQNIIDTGYANCIDCGSNKLSKVESYGENDFGLFDMLGNVWEWTEGCYHDSYEGTPETVLKEGKPWTENKCTLYVARGGSWDNLPHRIRSAARHRFARDKPSNTVGFRIAGDVTSADDR